MILSLEFEYLFYLFCTLIFLYFLYTNYKSKEKINDIKYALETVDSNIVIIHKSDCKMINSIENIFIINYFNTYDDAFEHVTILEYNSNNCSHCITNDLKQS